MRVISGTARGLKLDSLEGENTRPTLDRIKESLFNIIHSKIRDAYVLDLFAGSGSLGIECASRGAKEVVFCDQSKQAINIIKKNIKKARIENETEVILGDFQNCLTLDKKYDIIFLDPPYKTDLVKRATEKIIEKDILKEDGILVIETDDEEKIKKDLESLGHKIDIYDQRKYGRVKLIFVRKG